MTVRIGNVYCGCTAPGYIQVAHVGFIRPRWISGQLNLLTPNCFEFRWNNVVRKFERANGQLKTNSNYQFDHDEIVYNKKL